MAKRYIIPSEVGAAAEEHNHSADEITSGLLALARLGSGTPDSGDYLRGDGVWADLAAAVTALASGGAEAGDLKASARSAPSTGWALCDGTAVPRTGGTYDALFAAIGTTYGVGNGSTTFNLPDFRGRTIIGAGTGTGLTARSRGNTGGAEGVALAKGEIPAHTHTYPRAGAVQTDISPSGGRTLADGTAGVTANGVTDGLKVTPDAHNNMQPYGVANVFIKL